MTEARTAWAAGLFEGEGCFFARRVGGQAYPTATLIIADQDVILRFAAIAGSGTITKERRKPGRKQTWRWTLCGAEYVRDFGERLRPFLGKRRTAKLDALFAEYDAVRSERADRLRTNCSVCKTTFVPSRKSRWPTGRHYCSGPCRKIGDRERKAAWTTT